MKWYAAYSTGILRGSLCQASDPIQLIWIKLMAMANEAKDPDSGRLEFARGQPYSIAYIAAAFFKTEAEIELALEAYQKDFTDGVPRITIEADGTIVLNNWVTYQNRTEQKGREDGGKPTSNAKLPIDKEVDRAYAAKKAVKDGVQKGQEIDPEVAERTLDEIAKPSTRELRRMNRELKVTINKGANL